MNRYIDADKFIFLYRKLYCEKCNRRTNSKGKFVYDIGGVACKACRINDVLDDIDDFADGESEVKE